MPLIFVGITSRIIINEIGTDEDFYSEEFMSKERRFLLSN
jgi:hypothetical protein